MRESLVKTSLGLKCYACGRRTSARCPSCGNPYCDKHGDDVCQACIPSIGFASSALLFRGVVLAFVVAVAFSAWVLYANPATEEPTPAPKVVSAAAPIPTVPAVQPEAQVTPVPSPIISTSTPVPTPTPAPPQNYTVKAGDTIGGIGEKFGLSGDELMRANNIKDPTLLQIGQVLQIPSGVQPAATPKPEPTATPGSANYVNYTVKPGDTLSGIASNLGTTVQEIININGLGSPDRLQIGQTLRIPKR